MVGFYPPPFPHPPPFFTPSFPCSLIPSYDPIHYSQELTHKFILMTPICIGRVKPSYYVDIIIDIIIILC